MYVLILRRDPSRVNPTPRSAPGSAARRYPIACARVRQLARQLARSVHIRCSPSSFPSARTSRQLVVVAVVAVVLSDGLQQPPRTAAAADLMLARMHAKAPSPAESRATLHGRKPPTTTGSKSSSSARWRRRRRRRPLWWPPAASSDGCGSRPDARPDAREGTLTERTNHHRQQGLLARCGRQWLERRPSVGASPCRCERGSATASRAEPRSHRDLPP
jgi:hypothetical protein